MIQEHSLKLDHSIMPYPLGVGEEEFSSFFSSTFPSSTNSNSSIELPRIQNRRNEKRGPDPLKKCYT